MTARARGFNEAWHPRPESWELLSSVQHVLDEYVEQLPLTLRQIFYIHVGRHAYEKTESISERATGRGGDGESLLLRMA